VLIVSPSFLSKNKGKKEEKIRVNNSHIVFIILSLVFFNDNLNYDHKEKLKWQSEVMLLR